MVSWPLIQPSPPSPIPDIPHSTLHTLLHTPYSSHISSPTQSYPIPQPQWRSWWDPGRAAKEMSTGRTVVNPAHHHGYLPNLPIIDTMQSKAKAWFWSTAFLWTKFCRLGGVIWVSLGWLSHTFSFSFNPWILAIYDFPMFSGHGKREESWLDNYADLFAVSCEPCLWHPRHCIFLCSIQGWPGSGIENTRTRLDLTKRERT